MVVATEEVRIHESQKQKKGGIGRHVYIFPGRRIRIDNEEFFVSIFSGWQETVL